MKLPIVLLLLLTALGLTVIGEEKAARSSTEDWRPRFHFSAKKSGLGDPNGLFFHDGKWHLQYQTGWPPEAFLRCVGSTWLISKEIATTGRASASADFPFPLLN